MHLKVNTCHLYPRNAISDSRLILTTFLPSKISVEHFTTNSALFCFFCFSMDKVKLVKLGNWVLFFPTCPSWLFLHFLGLACYFHILDNSLMLFPTREVLDRFSKCFIHVWGFCYILVSWPFWALWVVSIQFNFPMRNVLFMYTIIHNYSMEGYMPIFISSFMWFSLFSSLYFCCVCLWEFWVERSISCASY